MCRLGRVPVFARHACLLVRAPPPVAQSLGDVGVADVFCAFQVGDGAGDAQGPAVLRTVPIADAS